MTYGCTLPILRPERPKKRRIRRRPQSIYQWLRERTSSIDFGMKHEGHPIHCNKNRDVLEAFAGRRWLDRMTNLKFNAHFSGEETFYFTGNGRSRSNETLVNLDIDCHKSGTLTGAIAFAEHLRAHHFPNLYFEVSTNGNGVHAYIVLKKDGDPGVNVNHLLERLEQHLKGILVQTGFDVENVEVKGTCPVLVWGRKKGELLNYRSGQLAKLPREVHRFDELKNTACISTWDLLQLSPVSDEDPLPRIRPLPKAEGSISDRLVLDEDGGPRLHRSRKAEDSISGRLISDEELAELNGHYRRVAETLLRNQPLRTSSRAIAVLDDVAIFLMLLQFFTGNMNVDGSLPQKRFKELWTSLFQAGDINRPFDDKRFAAIRNYLSSLGLIDWEDATFRIGWLNDQGVYQRGKAAKWKASQKLMDMLEWESSTAELGRRGASFTGTTLLQTILKLVRVPDDEVIKPVEVDETASWAAKLDEIDRLVKCFDEQVEMAA
jgi:hypothetical protein